VFVRRKKKSELQKKIIINICHPPPDGVKLSLRIDPDKHATPLGSEIILLPSFLYTCDPAGVINLNPNQKILAPQESHMYRERPSLKHTTPLGSSISIRTNKILTPEESHVIEDDLH
jgi:hypothetical protein